MRLRALHEALAKNAARANGNHALDDVKPFAQRVTRGVKQGTNALRCIELGLVRSSSTSVCSYFRLLDSPQGVKIPKTSVQFDLKIMNRRMSQKERKNTKKIVCVSVCNERFIEK